MRYRLLASYQGAPYEAGVGPTDADIVLFAACPPPEDLRFEPATGHWRKHVSRDEVQSLHESRPVGVFRGERCIVLDDLGDRLHIVYLGHDAYRAEQLGYWEVDRGVFELVTPRQEVTDIAEQRLPFPGLPDLAAHSQPGASAAPRRGDDDPLTGPLAIVVPGQPYPAGVAMPAADEPPLPLEAEARRAAAAGRSAKAGQRRPQAEPDQPPADPEISPAPGLPPGAAREPAIGLSQPAGLSAPSVAVHAAQDQPGPAVPSWTPPATVQAPGQVSAPDPATPQADPFPMAPDPAPPPAAYAPPSPAPQAPEPAPPLAAPVPPSLLQQAPEPAPQAPEPAPPPAAYAPSASPPDIPLLLAAPALLSPDQAPPPPPAMATAAQPPAVAPDSAPSLTAVTPPAPAPSLTAVTPPAPAPPAPSLTAVAPPRAPSASDPTSTPAQANGLPGIAPQAEPGRQPERASGPGVQPEAQPLTERLARSQAQPGAPRRRRATRRRLPTQRIFSDLASQAAIPAAAYAIGDEVDGAMCLMSTDEGYEVFNAAAGARHEVRVFQDEESAYFYLFGVLVADAVRTGALAPRQ